MKRFFRRITSKFRRGPSNAFDGGIVFSSEASTDPRAEFGEFTYGVPEIFGWGEGTRLYVGNYCSIASFVKVFLGGGHRTDWISTYPFNALNDSFPNAADISGHPFSKGDVIIGNDVWIGQGAVIMSGVKIGDGAVIGAYSLVAKDVESYSIVAGNPARCVRKRFSDDDIEFLLALKWWDWPAAKVNEHAKILSSANIAALRQKFTTE